MEDAVKTDETRGQGWNQQELRRHDNATQGWSESVSSLDLVAETGKSLVAMGIRTLGYGIAPV